VREPNVTMIGMGFQLFITPDDEPGPLSAESMEMLGEAAKVR